MAATRVLDDARTAMEIGRAARLELHFARRGGRTVLAHAYAEPPFRIGKTFDEGEGGLHLVVASTAPGIFGGDHLSQSIVVDAGAHVRLTSQSSLQVHPHAEAREASIVSEFRVADRARLTCEWHPVIPFALARLSQTIAIDLDGASELYWSDAVMSGREARGERWQFARLAHELRVRVTGQLKYLERYDLTPSLSDPAQIWRAADANYFGTVVAIGAGIDRTLVDRLHDALQAIRGLRAAADLLEPRMLLIRLMAAGGVPFHSARSRLADRWLAP
jgi:urease accessory protein